MHGSKSPGPDGMSPIFFKQFWGTIGEEVISAVQSVFNGGSIGKAANHTFLTLIPKRQAANRVEHFRPIALCNVIYKIITKILATRLKGSLNTIIHSAQLAFIPTRSIVDNCIINHEIMHYLSTRKGKIGYMTIKVDMAKAYDMVEWDLLQAIIAAHGFNSEVNCILFECISTAHFSVLINGSLCGFFKSSRGIRQGDPVSPTLFTILTNLLSRLLQRAKNAGTISGVKISRNSPQISHFMYADNLVIYCKATLAEAQSVKECLNTYCEWSGQKINWDKSEIHFIPNVGSSAKFQLCRLLHLHECSHRGKYLGS